MNGAWRSPLVLGADEARAAGDLAARHSAPAPLGRALYFRGLRDDAAWAEFRELAAAGVPPLAPLKNLPAAAARLAAACRAGERVLVHGDYDVDGICGTALLTRALGMWGAKPTPFLPSRFEDGYGIAEAAIARVRDEQFDLMVTADCGTNHGALLDEAAAAGAAVIVCDHHLPVDGQQPVRALLINPHQAGDESGRTDYCGSAIALQLLMATGAELGRPVDPGSLAILAAIASITDVMPMTGPVRALVAEGLRRLPQARAPGLRALARQCRLEAPVRAEDIGFSIGPRINAAGRMGHPMAALELLLAADAPAAARAMAELEDCNERRREISARVFDSALREAETQGDRAVIAVGAEGWHIGVMGIVAQRLREATGKPAIAVAFDEGGLGTGSGRSAGGIHLEGLLAAQRDKLIRAGGHAAACGLTVRRERWEAFREALWTEAARLERTPEEIPQADAHAEPGELDLKLLAAIHALEPWGTAMPVPRFEVTARIRTRRRFGRDAGKPHAELMLAGAPLPLVYWRGADRLAELGDSVRLLVRPGRDNWIVDAAEAG